MRIRPARLLAYPHVRLVARGADRTHLQIDGLVCDRVCGVRAGEALRRLPGVTAVAVDFEHGVATIEGDAIDIAECERAVDAVVSAKGVRRLLHRLSHSRSAREVTA
jgi:hypothetical protein